MKIFVLLSALLLSFYTFSFERLVNSSQRGIKTFEVKTVAGTNAASQTISKATVNLAGSSTITDVISTTAAHGFVVGDRVRFTGTSGSLTFGGTATGTDYFVIPVASASLSVASTLADAIAGSAVDLTTTGSGTLYLSIVEIKQTKHGFITGDHVRLTTSGTLPAGTATGTDYWVLKDSANKFRLSSSLANALAGTAVDWVTNITDATGSEITATQVEKLDGPAKLRFSLQFQSAGVYKLSFVDSGLFPSTSQMVGVANSNDADIAARISTYNTGYVTITTRSITNAPAATNAFFSLLLFGSNVSEFY